MDQEGNIHRALEVYRPPQKRRRGRPRKHPRRNADREENVVPQILPRQESSPIAPRFSGVHDHQHRHFNANAIAVGQLVHGIIDAPVNGGYLLTVRVANSDITMRGVVFKSGVGAPAATNYDAMISRYDHGVPIPADRSNRLVVYNPQSREFSSESAEVLHHAAPETLKLPFLPCENLPTEYPSQSEKTQMIPITIKDHGKDQPDFVEPVQTLLPDLNIPASPPPQYVKDF